MTDWETRTAILVSTARRALEKGEIHIPPSMEGVADLVSAPLTPMGLVDISKLSQAGIAIGRASGLALEAKDQLFPKQQEAQLESLAPDEAQCELFRLFELLFGALTGVAVEHVKDFDEVRERLLWRYTNEFRSLADSFNAAAGELAAFYTARGGEIFRYAKGLGGMKAVAGGQRQFTEAALDATRISGLYLDTQLIPDPVYPFLAGNLSLNAMHLQLAHVLYFVLQLAPLANARLPVPAVVVFPSFEEPLEENDPYTKAGLERMLLQLAAPLCEGTIGTVGELLDYAAKKPDKYLPAVMAAQLFVPQGHAPGEFKDAGAALRAHVSDMKGMRSSQTLEALKRVPIGVAVTISVLERLRPQFHLLENAYELNAQPMMALPVQWHYFGLCAEASARDLVNKQVLSEANFFTLRALQDESVSWLGNIPIEGLVELRRNMEVANFREELKKVTSQLAAAGPLELNDVVKEVNHGLASLVQRHAKAMEEVRAKYSPKVAGFASAAVVGAVGGLGLSFLPALAVAAGVAAPVGAALGALGGGALGAVRELTGAAVERRHLARHSLVGILAAAKAKK